MGIPLDALAKLAPEPDLAKIGRSLWRRKPTLGEEATRFSPEELNSKIDEYFTAQYDADRHPTLCDMAGETGFDSVTQMVNHARRKGGKTMRGISRGVLAVAASYEELAQEGSRQAMHMLSLMPQFDSKEPADQKPQRPFLAQQEISLNITGINARAERGQQLTEQEAYLKLIKHKTYEEISAAAAAMETEQTEEGDYRVVEIEMDE